MPLEKPRWEKKGLKRRVVSGAVMEEGRAPRLSALRGGARTGEHVEKRLLEAMRLWWKRGGHVSWSLGIPWDGMTKSIC